MLIIIPSIIINNYNVIIIFDINNNYNIIYIIIIFMLRYINRQRPIYHQIL